MCLLYRDPMGGRGRGWEKRKPASRQSSTNLVQRLLVASEKQISAKLSITEVLYTSTTEGEQDLSSRGILC